MSNYNLKQIIVSLLLNKYCTINYNNKLIGVKYVKHRYKVLEEFGNYYMFVTYGVNVSNSVQRQIDYIKLLSKSTISNNTKNPIFRSLYINEDEMYKLRQYVKS